MESNKLNGVVTYAPHSRKALMEYAFENKNILVAVNAEKILHATDEMRAIINRNVGYPDGTGAVWALKRKGHKNAQKIPGCEFWLDIVNEHYLDKTFYLVGGKDDVIAKTVFKLNHEFPGIKILNYRNGFLRDNEERMALVHDVYEKKPDVVFVAMGSPKQEILMEEMHRQHPAVYQGLGGSFDVFTGQVKRAPRWWVNNNMEWTYRLLSQPSRIKRQIHLLRFFFNLRLNKL